MNSIATPIFRAANLAAICTHGVVATLFLASTVGDDQLLVEAESFRDSGGWNSATQFIDIMGSLYLLSNGLGRSVADAVQIVPADP